MTDVFNPERLGNTVVPLRSSKECFSQIAKAIEGAKESVDIITMGIETDMRLIRSNPTQRNRILKYKRAYPAEPENPADGSPDKDSYIISDLLTRVSREKHPDPETKEMRDRIKVRILAIAPRGIGNCFYDPLHFWYRCKRFKGLPDDPYENITFALRGGKGDYVRPPDDPEFDAEGLSLWERMNLAGCKGLDDLSRILFNIPGFYDWIFTHHQKLVVIDMNLPEAKAFVIGSNMNEDYWDDPDHLLYNPLRMPYGPWRDAGLWVQGPVLRDIADNIKENWEVMARTEAEFLPDELIAEGIRAERSGMLREDEGLFAGTASPKNHFDFKLYQELLGFAPFMGVALGLRKGDPLKVLAVCAGLALAVDVAGGLLDGTLLADTSMIKKTAPWDGQYRGEDGYQTDPAEGLSVQFDRTFCQEGAPQDFSIRHGLYRAVRKAAPSSLIYIENQYFRDLHLVQILKDLVESGGIRPYLVVVTSDTRQTSEGILSSGPTFRTYAMLKEAGIDFHFCKLRTREHGPLILKNPETGENEEFKFLKPRYEKGVGEIILSGALDVLKFLLILSPLALLMVRNRFKNLRDVLWAAIPSLLYGARQGLGPSGATLGLSRQSLEKVLGDVDKLATLLATLQDPENPLAKVAGEMRENPGTRGHISEAASLLGGEADEPIFPGAAETAADKRKNAEILETLEKLYKQTPQGVPAPDTGKNDPGNIYVHTKAIVVNGLFAMLGSANHNERSMWHDTEDMLAVRGWSAQDFPGKLQKELLHTVLAGNMPESTEGKEMFEWFTAELRLNVTAYHNKTTQSSLVFPYIPGASLGISVIC